jgi:hypothetical protein
MGFTSKKWRNSNILKCADRLPQGAELYTNRPELFYLHRNQRLVPSSPARTGSAWARYFGWDTKWWLGQLDASNGPKYLVWFEKLKDWRVSGVVPRADLLQPNEIAKIVPLTLVEKCGDGAIYLLDMSSGSAPENPIHSENSCCV